MSHNFVKKSLGDSCKISWVSSPNYGERKLPITAVVIHYTQLGSDETVSKFSDPFEKVSAHFLIHKDATFTQFVCCSKRAWHAGVSSFKGQEDVNSLSIGIELEYLGPDENGNFPSYEKPQILSLVKLLDILVKKYNIPYDHIVGHSDIAPLRKIDPGPMFPWDFLGKHGFKNCFPSIKNLLDQKLRVL